MSKNKSEIEATARLLSLNDEQKIKCAVRAISGESLPSLALEFGVSESVIQGWVDRVSDMVENKAVGKDEDLEKKIAEARAKCYETQKEIERRKRQVAMLETELRMRKECPSFMQVPEQH